MEESEENVTLASLLEGQDSVWILLTSFFIFGMQTGFTMLEVGMISTRFQVDILLKNLVHMAAGASAFFICGWALSKSEGGNGFVGYREFFLMDTIAFADFMFHMSSVSTTMSAVSGAIVGRMRFVAYACACIFIAAITYPIAVHWVMTDIGWLTTMHYQDFSAAGPVHLVGGMFGLFLTWYMGPRIGLFTHSGRQIPLRSSPVLTTLGSFILISAWFALNAGSSDTLVGSWGIAGAKAAANTGIAVAFGVFCSMAISLQQNNWKYINIFDAVIGSMGAVVAITSACAYVHPWHAGVIGGLSSFVTHYSVKILTWLQIDDPVDSIPVHVSCAVWGILAVGLFAVPDVQDGFEGGLFYTGSFHLLGIQALGVVVISAWGVGNAIVFAFLMGMCMKSIRVSEEVEIKGSGLSDAYELDTDKTYGKSNAAFEMLAQEVVHLNNKMNSLQKLVVELYNASRGGQAPLIDITPAADEAGKVRHSMVVVEEEEEGEATVLERHGLSTYVSLSSATDPAEVAEAVACAKACRGLGQTNNYLMVGGARSPLGVSSEDRLTSLQKALSSPSILTGQHLRAPAFASAPAPSFSPPPRPVRLSKLSGRSMMSLPRAARISLIGELGDELATRPGRKSFSANLHAPVSEQGLSEAFVDLLGTDEGDAGPRGAPTDQCCVM